jgi:SAM-dependent methyltransferase
MDRSATTADDRPAAQSAAWQAAGVAAHAAELTAYLEQVVADPRWREVAGRALRELALAPGRRVLEVGCGPGVFLPLLAQVVGVRGTVVGIDHAPEFVAQARERVAGLGLGSVVTVEVTDAYRLPFPDASFDAAHCERVLMHLVDPVAALREMARVVRPGGRVVAVEPDWRGVRIDHPDRDAFDLLMGRWLERHQNSGMGLELRRCFAEAGLTKRRAEAVILNLTDFAELARFGLDLSEPAQELVAEGRLERERARAAIDYLTTASQGGTFFAYGAVTVATGEVAPTEVTHGCGRP